MITLVLLFFFFFNDTATTEIYTLSLHDALPISERTDMATVPAPRLDLLRMREYAFGSVQFSRGCPFENCTDRKSTRLNSSHQIISYAVFCLKKKNDGAYNNFMSNHVSHPPPL